MEPGIAQTERTLIVADGVDWLALFEQEGVHVAILDRRTDSDLIGALRLRPGWVLDFGDTESVIFARRLG